MCYVMFYVDFHLKAGLDRRFKKSSSFSSLTFEIIFQTKAVVFDENRFLMTVYYLDDKRSILRTGLKTDFSVPRVFSKHRAVKHGRVAELSAMTSTQHPPSQLTGVHHGRHHVLGTPQSLPQVHLQHTSQAIH